MAKIIAVVHTKGGVGKSTTAVQLALGLANENRPGGAGEGEKARVWLVDGDRQQTSLSAITARQEAGRPAIAASAYDQGATLRVQVLQQAGAYDYIVLDCGGRDNSALRAALTVADVALVPFLPRSFDVWAFQDIANLLDETRAVHDIRAFAFLNLADPQGSDNDDAAAAVKGYPQLKLAPFRMARRKAIAHASGGGLHITEYRPRDDRACEEVEQLQRYLVDTVLQSN